MKNAVNSISTTGFYRIRLIDKDGKITEYENHNFVANNMKKIALAESMSMLFKTNIGNPYGCIICSDNSQYVYSEASGGFANFNELESSCALVLLNLDNSVEMDQTTKYINIIAEDGSGIDESKITGFSVGKSSSSNLKEGVIQDITSADMMINQYQVVNTFMFDLDKANGDFNWIAIMPNFQNPVYRSLMAWKCISNYNIRKGGTFISGYIPPNVKDTKGNVLTNNSEILTFENDGNSSKWIYNLETGEKRAVQPSSFAYNWTNSNIVGSAQLGHQLVIGDHLFAISGVNLYKIEIETGANVGSVKIADSYLGNGNQFGMYFTGTEIIVSCATTSSYENRGYVSKINPADLTASKTNNSDYEDWGNLPKDWDKRSTMFTKVGTQYFVQNVAASTKYPNTNYTGCVIICTDIMNVCGSIVGIMPTNGFNAYEASGNAKAWCIQEFNDNPDVQLVTDTDTKTRYNYSGIYISDLEYSNYWSASKLDKTYTKTKGLKAIIDYGYAFSLN